MFKILLLLCWLTAASSYADPVPAVEPAVAAAAAAGPEDPGASLEAEPPVDSASVVESTQKTGRNAAAAAAAAAAAGNITFTTNGPASCPPAHLFAPCDCFIHGEKARILRCSGEYNIDLNPIFQRLSIYLPKPDKHFHMFYLNNSNLTYLGNVFHDITFEYICKYI